jgi:hypothetical protein
MALSRAEVRSAGYCDPPDATGQIAEAGRNKP